MDPGSRTRVQPPSPPKCPECQSTRVWKDGLRQNGNGPIQRWLCRECGYRFSEGSSKTSRSSKISGNFEPIDRLDTQILFRPSALSLNRQVCETLVAGSKNLAEVSPETGVGQREATETSKTSELILDYAWQMKKRGLAELTIKLRVYRLKLLAKRGADLMDPESVSTTLATSNWTDTNKRVFIVAYKSFAALHKLPWEPPKTSVERKLPFIPTEEEIDQLIAGCGRKTATFLQVLKDTAARTAEAAKLRWTDIDEKSSTIRINNPVKGSLARVVKVSPKTIAMINNLPKTGDFIFNPKPHTIRQNFQKQRHRIMRTLQNPRLKQIHLHTFRHWKATMEYHRTLNIKYVQQLLGHKKLENTDMYTQLINFESDEWHVAHARNLEEEDKLIEAGFEYVRYSEKDEVAIYRKRK
ncbi:MAG: tyrosine-type recombinase/integrase [Candidatus Bathyarchaeia archaeon]